MISGEGDFDPLPYRLAVSPTSPIGRGLFILLFLFPVLASAQEKPKEDYANYYLGVNKREGMETFWKADLTDAQTQFILDYRQVRVKKDRELLDRLIHPASLACENEMRKDYFIGMRHFYLNESFPRDFKVKFFPVPEEKQWPLKRRMEFPEAPTHILYIEYKDGEYTEGLQRFLREEEDRYFELTRCPSRKTLEKMAAEAAEE
jgi:hypothetical protein